MRRGAELPMLWAIRPATTRAAMSSRVQQKAAARERREAAEAAERRATARRRALGRLGVLAAVALIVVAAVIVVSRTGGAGTHSDDGAETAAVFAGIPQDGVALGSANSPATLTEFADLQCPFCAEYAREVLPSVVDRYVRPGRLRLELGVLTFLGEDSVRAGQMAAAAARQNRLWQFADAFYRRQGAENSGYATDAFLRDAAAAAGLDAERALGERGEPGVRRFLDRAQRSADGLGARSTPAFYLRRGSR